MKKKGNMNDYQYFIAVAREKSFTKAAAQLGISQSAVSYAIRTLETSLGLRLLTRTTRSVSVTEAGERLISRIGPYFDEIENEIVELSRLKKKPVGTVRITAVEHAVDTILWPKLYPMMLKYPDINIEIISEYGLKDIVAERYDAGVRLGEQVDMDMISMPLAKNFCFAVVGSPSYFKGKTQPKTPHDLSNHSCIKLRLPTHGGFYTWEFRKNGIDIKVHINGRTTFSTINMMHQAAIDGLGIAYLPLDTVEANIKNGKLIQLLTDWCPPRSPYHFYYPNRRHHTPAFELVLKALRIHN